ncbi:hypothetical protein [Rhizobium redzepovicii]
MNRFGSLIACLLLAGCSTSTQDLESKPSTTVSTFSYPDNYQLIFKRVSDEAKRCGIGNLLLSQASLQVDSQLYNELGYGEVSQSMINVGVRNFYWKAKIERAGVGSKMTVYSGNTLNNGAAIKRVSAWADGNHGCG